MHRQSLLLVPLLYVCMCLCDMWNDDYNRVPFVINNFHQINTSMQGTVFIMPTLVFFLYLFVSLFLSPATFLSQAVSYMSQTYRRQLALNTTVPGHAQTGLNLGLI